MKLFLFVILLSGSCWAGRFTARSSGNWNNVATWGGSQIPGNHDTVAVKDGVTLTVSDTRIIGMSGGNGSTAIDVGIAGALVIATGGKLQVRGDIVYGGGNFNSTYLTVQAGGILEWDSSQAASPRATKYSAHPDANYGFRGFVTTGSSSNHAIVRSNIGGGNGYFSLGGHPVGGSYVTTYTDFLRIGDAEHPAFEQWYYQTGVNLTPWDATHNTFTSCGMAPNVDTSGLIGADVWRHSFNVHTSSLGTTVLHGPVGSSARTTGIRQMVGNVFDIATDSGLDAKDFTIHSNYFGGFGSNGGLGTIKSATSVWTIFQNNIHPGWHPGGGGITLSGDSRDNLFLIDDADTNNPHVLLLGAAGAETISGNILDHTGDINTDSGEFVLVNIPLAPGVTYTIKNNILLPNAAGHASTEIISVMQCCSNTGNKFDIDHNTYCGQQSPGLNQDAIHTAEGGANPGGQLNSFRSNLLWASTANSSYKLLAQQNGNRDVCAPANCDYNDGWNLKTDGGGFSNGGKGYADSFSGTPGVHDLSVNPMFVDPTRNTATFDSAYLGNTPGPWSGDATYKVGDIVSSADPTVYKGAAINYRYVNGSVCSNANPKPGLYTAVARACWEWASLYRIRQAVAAQTLYDDQSIGAHGVDIITVLIQWIRSGFSPANPLLSLAGHDGQDIGAVPVSFASPDAPLHPPAPGRNRVPPKAGSAR
jgi:hypothetical protein